MLAPSTSGAEPAKAVSADVGRSYGQRRTHVGEVGRGQG